MTADHHPPRNGDDLDDGGHPALVGDLGVLLAAHVDESVATDAAWAEIVRSARDHGAARSAPRPSKTFNSEVPIIPAQRSQAIMVDGPRFSTKFTASGTTR